MDLAERVRAIARGILLSGREPVPMLIAPGVQPMPLLGERDAWFPLIREVLRQARAREYIVVAAARLRSLDAADSGGVHYSKIRQRPHEDVAMVTHYQAPRTARGWICRYRLEGETVKDVGEWEPAGDSMQPDEAYFDVFR